MNFWGKVKGDLKKGIKEGVAMLKEGTAAVKEKAEELTEEGKRQYRIFALKGKVHDWMAELGGKVYELSSRSKNPMSDTTVRLTVSRIKKLEAQIAKLEGKPKTPAKKKTSKK